MQPLVASYGCKPGDISHWEFHWTEDTLEKRPVFNMSNADIYNNMQAKECADYCMTPSVSYNFDLEICTTSAAPAYPTVRSQDVYLEKPNKKENNMGFEIESDQRNHLKRRLDTVATAKKDELKKTFHMLPVTLDTAKDVAAALASGQIEINPAYVAKDGAFAYGYFNTSMLQIIDPKRDEAGYDAAKKVMDKSFTEAKDKIIVLPLTEGLAALNAFESATFH